MEIDGLVVIGGDGSLAGAKCLCEMGVPCIGIPGTIDNDLAYSEMTLGFDTAVNVCVDCVRKIRATSRSHDRPHVVEVMGRHCGDIALTTAVSTGSEIVVVPEVPWSVEEVAEKLDRQLAKGNTRATIVLAEGCYASMAPFDLYHYLTSHGKQCYEGEPMSAVRLASVLKRMCGMVEVRATVIGYIQRGAEPTARDSAFAFEAGNLAVKLLRDGISNQVIGMQKGRVMYMPIDRALSMERPFKMDLLNLVNSL
jgi:6-phosphofructokinase 1